jgi:hypothetical protein
MTRQDPTRVADLKAAPYNPRHIDEDSKAALKKSFEEFGDISGIVFNFTTGNLVAGHQRTEVLKHYKQLEIEWGKWVKTPTGPERFGTFRSAEGQTFHIRGVKWPVDKEKAANLAANSPHIAGQFTAEMADVLASIKESDAVPFEDLRFEQLELDALELIQPELPPELDDGVADGIEPKIVRCPHCQKEFQL